MMQTKANSKPIPTLRALGACDSTTLMKLVSQDTELESPVLAYVALFYNLTDMQVSHDQEVSFGEEDMGVSISNHSGVHIDDDALETWKQKLATVTDLLGDLQHDDREFAATLLWGRENNLLKLLLQQRVGEFNFDTNRILQNLRDRRQSQNFLITVLKNNNDTRKKLLDRFEFNTEELEAGIRYCIAHSLSRSAEDHVKKLGLNHRLPDGRTVFETIVLDWDEYSFVKPAFIDHLLEQGATITRDLLRRVIENDRLHITTTYALLTHLINRPDLKNEFFSEFVLLATRYNGLETLDDIDAPENFYTREITDYKNDQTLPVFHYVVGYHTQFDSSILDHHPMLRTVKTNSVNKWYDGNNLAHLIVGNIAHPLKRFWDSKTHTLSDLADWTEKNSLGQTPLHCLMSHQERIKRWSINNLLSLLNCDALYTCTNMDSVTPIESFLSKCHEYNPGLLREALHHSPRLQAFAAKYLCDVFIGSLEGLDDTQPPSQIMASVYKQLLTLHNALQKKEPSDDAKALCDAIQQSSLATILLDFYYFYAPSLQAHFERKTALSDTPINIRVEQLIAITREWRQLTDGSYAPIHLVSHDALALITKPLSLRDRLSLSETCHDLRAKILKALFQNGTLLQQISAHYPCGDEVAILSADDTPLTSDQRLSLFLSRITQQLTPNMRKPWLNVVLDREMESVNQLGLSRNHHERLLEIAIALPKREAQITTLLGRASFYRASALTQLITSKNTQAVEKFFQCGLYDLKKDELTLKGYTQLLNFVLKQDIQAVLPQALNRINELNQDALQKCLTLCKTREAVECVLSQLTDDKILPYIAHPTLSAEKRHELMGRVSITLADHLWTMVHKALRRHRTSSKMHKFADFFRNDDTVCSKDEAYAKKVGPEAYMALESAQDKRPFFAMLADYLEFGPAKDNHSDLLSAILQQFAQPDFDICQYLPDVMALWLFDGHSSVDGLIPGNQLQQEFINDSPHPSLDSVVRPKPDQLKNSEYCKFYRKLLVSALRRWSGFVQAQKLEQQHQSPTTEDDRQNAI